MWNLGRDLIHQVNRGGLVQPRGIRHPDRLLELGRVPVSLLTIASNAANQNVLPAHSTTIALRYVMVERK